MDIVRDALLPMVKGASRGEDFEQLIPAIALASRAVPPTEVSTFEGVPAAARPVFSPGSVTVLSQLKKLDEDIEFSSPPLTPQQTTELASAQKLLYDNGGDDTKTYKTYKEYSAKYQGLARTLKGSTNIAERTNAQVEIQTLQQDWQTYGQRTQVQHALEITAKYSPDKAKRLHEDWQRLLTSQGVGDYSNFWDTLSTNTDWTDFTMSVTPQQVANLRLNYAALGNPDANQLVAGLSRISFKMRLYRIPRPAFTHAFLTAPNWRNSKSYVLSDGSPVMHPSELVPRLVSALVVIKSLELAFATADSWQSLASVSDRSGTENLGGLPLKGPGLAPPYLAPRYLSTSQPYIVAVFVTDVPTIPNPNPSDTWPYWPWDK